MIYILSLITCWIGTALFFWGDTELMVGTGLIIGQIIFYLDTIKEKLNERR